MISVEKMVKVSKLNGMKVITTDAFTIGEVNGADVDTELWQITHLHVALTSEITKELGFKKPLLGHLTVCLPIHVVKSTGDVITLNKQLEQLKVLPECKHG